MGTPASPRSRPASGTAALLLAARAAAAPVRAGGQGYVDVLQRIFTAAVDGHAAVRAGQPPSGPGQAQPAMGPGGEEAVRVGAQPAAGSGLEPRLQPRQVLPVGVPLGSTVEVEQQQPLQTQEQQLLLTQQSQAQGAGSPLRGPALPAATLAREEEVAAVARGLSVETRGVLQVRRGRLRRRGHLPCLRCCRCGRPLLGATPAQAAGQSAQRRS